MCLKNGTLWPMPVCLDIPEAQAKALRQGQSVALRDSEGFMLAVMGIESIWPIDKEKEAEIVFGTRDDVTPAWTSCFTRKGTIMWGGHRRAPTAIAFRLQTVSAYAPGIAGSFQKAGMAADCGVSHPEPAAPSAA
jgi:ATP sulfurylase